MMIHSHSEMHKKHRYSKRPGRDYSRLLEAVCTYCKKVPRQKRMPETFPEKATTCTCLASGTSRMLGVEWRRVPPSRFRSDDKQIPRVQAIVGETPSFGLHVKENREDTVLVNLDQRPIRDPDYLVLGTYPAVETGESIPVLTDFPKDLSGDHPKSLDKEWSFHGCRQRARESHGSTRHHLSILCQPMGVFR
jgi:hypothetical protein